MTLAEYKTTENVTIRGREKSSRFLEERTQNEALPAIQSTE